MAGKCDLSWGRNFQVGNELWLRLYVGTPLESHSLLFKMIPTPTQIFASFERGEIGRDEMHAMMALHARELIKEIEEDRQNPASALIENLLARRSVSRLVRRHSGRLFRDILVALAELEDFPPSRYLWNASHLDVPLYCFLRMRREPVFRISSIQQMGQEVVVEVEHGSSARGKATVRKFLLRRDGLFKLRVVR